MISNASGYNLKKRKKRFKRKQMIQKYTLLLLIFIAVIIVLYFLISLRFQNRFLPGTTINGIKVAGKTVDDSKTMLEEYGQNYALEIKFRNEQTEIVTGTSIQYTYSVDDCISDLLKSQHSIAWFGGIIKAHEYEISFHPQFSAELLQAELDRLPEMQTVQMIRPEDAGIVFQNGEFQIIPEVDGTTFEPAAVTTMIQTAIRNCDRELDLTESDVYAAPSVRSDDADLMQTAKNLNQYCKASVTYQMYNNDKEICDIDTMKEWLTQDENGFFSFDPDQWNQGIADYVEELAKSYDTVYRTHRFRTTSGTEVVLPADGYYGWKIDVTEEIEKLTDDISRGTTAEREPVYKKREASSADDNYGFGDTYCEISLTGQHMWIYKNGELKLETDIVSGTNTDKRRTPAGAFVAYDKQSPKVLQGDRQEDGTFGYRSEVDYWIRMTEDGVGIHDAPWRSSFGGYIWLENGSHGCINVPAGQAQTIYNLIDDGMPICAYYLN